MKQSVKRIFLYLAVPAVLMTQGGCVCVFQSSAALGEAGKRYRLAYVSEATEAYRCDDGIILRVPTTVARIRYTVVAGGIMPAAMGGNDYFPIDAPDTNITVLVKMKNINVPFGDRSWIAGSVLAELPSGAVGIPIPDFVKTYDVMNSHRYDINYGFTTGSSAVLVETQVSDCNSFYRLLSYLDLVCVDVPVSLVMTLTGTVWYVPLAREYF